MEKEEANDMGVPTFLETGHMAEGFPIRLIYTGAEFNYAAHWHDEVELVIVTGKHARIGVNEQIFELNQGDMVLIKPGTCIILCQAPEG